MSGSATRKRHAQVLVRLTTEEHADIAAKADRAGMAQAAFLRAAALGTAGPRAQRRPPADHVALRQLLGELGRVGNNINQIARTLNMGEAADLPALNDALAAYLDIRNAIFVALGKDTPDDNQGQKPGRS